MKSEQIENLPIEWKRGNGLRKSDLDETGKNKCILYGELYTKHKTVLIDSQTLSKTNKQGKIYSKKGDILIPGTSTAAKKDMLLAREVNEDGILLGGDINIIRPKQGLFAQKYLPYYFMTQMAYQQLDRYITGATGIIHISNKGLKKLKVPLLSLPEQQRIVEILDKAFVAIGKAKQNAEQNLSNAKEVFENYLQGVLSDKKWSIVKLDNVCDKVEYGSSSKSSDEGDIPVLRMGNIQNGRFVWDDLKYSNNEEDNKKYLLRYNDVLFNRTNSPELVGKTAIYKSEMPAIFAGYLIRIHRKKDLLNADYLNYYLNSQMAKNYGDTVVISSVNQANINGKKLKTYPIPLPTLDEQKKIVQQLDNLSAETKKLETIYQKKLANLAELKKSILQKAFSGEL